MAYRSRTSTRMGEGMTSLTLRLVMWVIVAIVLFYISWLATTYARTYLSPTPHAAASTTSPSLPIAARTSTSSAVNSAGTNVNNNAPPPSNLTQAVSSAAAPTPTSANTVTIAGNVIDVDVSSTTAEIDQGLQYRQSLADNQGMLFLFSHAATYRFWMPNMDFSLDMIWIGSNMQVVDITHDAPPLPDPTKPVWFSPKTPAQYVVEVNAGYADEHNIQIGDTVTFNLSNS